MATFHLALEISISGARTISDVACAHGRSLMIVPPALLPATRRAGFAASLGIIFDKMHEIMKSESQLWNGFVRSSEQFPQRPAIQVGREITYSRTGGTSQAHCRNDPGRGNDFGTSAYGCIRISVGNSLCGRSGNTHGRARLRSFEPGVSAGTNPFDVEAVDVSLACRG